MRCRTRPRRFSAWHAERRWSVSRSDERKPVTILFTDVAGTTAGRAARARGGPAGDAALLRDAVARVCERHGGTVESSSATPRWRSSGSRPRSRTMRCGPCARRSSSQEDLRRLNDELERRGRADRDPHRCQQRRGRGRRRGRRPGAGDGRRRQRRRAPRAGRGPGRVLSEARPRLVGGSVAAGRSRRSRCAARRAAVRVGPGRHAGEPRPATGAGCWAATTSCA